MQILRSLPRRDKISAQLHTTMQLHPIPIIWLKGMCAGRPPKNPSSHTEFPLHDEKERLNLTSIKLTIIGAQAWAEVSGPLTSGMVGLPVTIEYDEAWDGLTKNLVCRCSPWGSDQGTVRTILNVDQTAVVAHEVMQAGQYLHLGVEGFREDGTLVIPTTWARCEEAIRYGATGEADPSADPTLPMWNQLQAQIEQINRDGITQEKLDEIYGCVEAAAHSATRAERAMDNSIASSNFATRSMNSAAEFATQAEESEKNAQTYASSAANIANGALQAQRAAEAAAERAEAAAAPGGASGVLETVPDNNLLDVSAAVTSFVDSTGATVTGSFSNYIPVRKGLRYVTNMAPTNFCWFDRDKQHLSTKFYTSSPKILEPEQDGFLLVRLPANASGSLVLEGTDIDAYRPEHPRLKPELLPNPWAGKRCLVVADSNGEYVRPGFAELVTRDLEMVLHNISAGGQTITGGMAQLDTVGGEFDLVLVMLGTNDQGYNNTLGAIDDTTGSYYANLKLMIAKLKAKFPTSVVVMMTMFKRTAVGSEAGNNADGFWINGQGLTTEDYRDAVIEVCGLYSIPCIDLYNTIDLRTEADRKLWALAVGDGTHPNALAHAVKIAPVVKAGILAHTPYVFPAWSENTPDVPVEPEAPDEPVTYTITNNLTKVTTSNSASSVTSGTAYTARLTAADGYAIDAVTVTMGGADVTADSYADGIVSISAVTGNITITASAVVSEEPDDGSPKLIHAWGTGVFDASLEDTVGNYDLTFWNEGHGIDGTAAMALQPGQSFSVRSKVARKTNLYRTQHHVHSGRSMTFEGVIGAEDRTGRFKLGLENSPNTGYQPNAYVTFVYLTANAADALSEKIVGTKPVPLDGTVEIAMTWDAETSTVRVYQDGELIGEQVTTVPLKFDGFRIQANYHTDEQAGSCPAEYVEIYRGVAEI